MEIGPRAVCVRVWSHSSPHWCIYKQSKQQRKKNLDLTLMLHKSAPLIVKGRTGESRGFGESFFYANCLFL